jgi:ADP-ribose pyrophosphatase
VAVVKPDASRAVYRGRLIGLTVERWGDHEREIVEHPGAVAIVAVDEDDRVTLVRQVREPARQQLLELPAGTIDPGEAPRATAMRELEEETGLRGGEWREAAGFWTTPGFCRERMTLFIAEGVQRGGSVNLDDDEQIDVVSWPVDEIAARLGEIDDAKTLVGLLVYLRLRGL